MFNRWQFTCVCIFSFIFQKLSPVNDDVFLFLCVYCILVIDQNASERKVVVNVSFVLCAVASICHVIFKLD